jgi:SAM-dependent methyltransferase
MLNTLERIADSWRRYDAATISQVIAAHDAMFVHGVSGAIEHYMSVGRSAIEVICRAMIAARKADIRSVLDLPCGAGRVTRHLAAFFPDAELYVADLDKAGAQFAAGNFGAFVIDTAVDFSAPPSREFDLIFVGSLVTHFDRPMFMAALRWFSQALAPGGILIVTTHGRRADFIETNVLQHLGSRWTGARGTWANSGFAFAETERRGDISYGFSFTRPFWVIGAAEALPGLRILGYQEGGWDDHQDVLSLQRGTLDHPVGAAEYDIGPASEAARRG